MSTKPNTSQITYDTGSNKQDLNSILDTVVPITDYTAFRNYTGRATQIRITSDGIAGFFKYDPTDTTSVDNSGTIIVAGSKRWKRVFDGVVSVKDFGADPSASAAVNTAAIQACLDAASDNTTIDFVGGYYNVSAPLVVPPNLTGCVFLGNGATIKCNHNGDGLVMIATNENFSRHKVYDLNVVGPNVSYPNNPSELAGTSTGAGLRMGYNDTSNTAAGYLTTFHSCTFSNFNIGVYLQATLLVNFYGGYMAFNQYGLYVDGGQTNANHFYGVGIRENRIAGVYSSGRTGGSLTNATHNTFYGCEIETNIPYDSSAGGYPSTFNGSGVGVGIRLLNSYDWIFDGCYSENHNYGVWLGSSSDDNKFVNHRLEQGGAGGVRSDGIIIDGAAVNNNLFRDCKISNLTSTVGNVTINNASGTNNNKFLDCVGFVFEAAKLAAYPYIQNNTKTQGSIEGSFFGAVVVPPQGIISNPSSGTSPGQIDGIGTAAATLNAFGVGEAMLGNQITAATTITSITNMRPGQLLVLSNYQIAYAVTIQSSADGTSGIVLQDRQNAVLSKYGDSITFYCMSVGRVIEVGRSLANTIATGTWTPTVVNSSAVSQPLTTATGTWCRVGNTVTVWFNVVSSNDLNDSNYYDVAGLPFTPQNASCVGIASNQSNAGNVSQQTPHVINAITSGSRLRVRVSPAADFQNVDGFAGMAVYQV